MQRSENDKVYQGLTPDPVGATREAMEVARGGRVPIAELFYSLQGEGLRTGQATVFVRMAGCNCDCWFCDTDFRVREEHTVQSLLDRVNVLGEGCRWVCLTGGEPTIHDLRAFCVALHGDGYRIQVETNGALPRPDWRLDHITVSPKIHEGARLDPWYLSNATEFKHVIDVPKDIDLALELSRRHVLPVLLQPNALNPAATALCVEAIKANPARFRLSLQTHKVLGLR
jgi:organic radical activating enzyme